MTVRRLTAANATHGGAEYTPFRIDYTANSHDDLPVISVLENSLLLEVDTGLGWLFRNGSWHPSISGGAPDVPDPLVIGAVEASDHISVGGINLSPVVAKFKSEDEERLTAPMPADDDLQFEMGPDEYWSFTDFLTFNGVVAPPAAGDGDLLAETNLLNAHTYTGPGLIEATGIEVVITDTTPSIVAGTVTINGFDPFGRAQSEELDISAGAGSYESYGPESAGWQSITSIVTAGITVLGGSGDETIKLSSFDPYGRTLYWGYSVPAGGSLTWVDKRSLNTIKDETGVASGFPDSPVGRAEGTIESGPTGGTFAVTWRGLTLKEGSYLIGTKLR